MPSRDIILLRHAHAEPGSRGQNDADRALTARGRTEADTAGTWLKSQGIRPDRLVSSPAARARETYAHVRAITSFGEAEEDQRIYDATPGDLIDVIAADKDADCTLLVGHNPGMESLVALLTDGASDNGRGMPTAAVVWLRLPRSAQLEPGAAEVRQFWWP